MTATPPLVERALAAAAERGSAATASDAGGPLRHVLAARRGLERVAELGTGAGVGTAWIAAALPPGVPLFTVERDPILAGAARALFAGDPDVHVLEGSWRDALRPEAPFDLVVADGSTAWDGLDAVLGIAAPGATLVLDGLSVPDGEPDPRRDAWLLDERVVAVELADGRDARAVVAVVRR